jgi:hypothetical protein
MSTGTRLRQHQRADPQGMIPSAVMTNFQTFKIKSEKCDFYLKIIRIQIIYEQWKGNGVRKCENGAFVCLMKILKV